MTVPAARRGRRPAIGQDVLATSKDSANPKDSLGALKVSLGVTPNVARIYWALAMADGAVKYGEMNWREKKVKMSVYLDAIERHTMALRAGEDLDVDPVTGAVVPHSGRIMACCSIIEDARASGNLIDDRRFSDKAVDVLKSLTAQSYSGATLALTRTPARTLDEVRGGPINFPSFVDALAQGQRDLAAFNKQREAAQQPPK